MGFFRAAFGSTPYYEYQVGVGPEEAVRRAVAFWRTQECQVADYDMDSHLREAGYTGTEVAGGGGLGTEIKNDLVEFTPIGWVLMLSSKTRLASPGPFQVGITAPLDGPYANKTTLFCFHASGNGGENDYFSPREYTEHQMIALGRALTRQGVLLAEPHRFTQRALPKDNPLRQFHWSRIRRTAIEGR